MSVIRFPLSNLFPSSLMFSESDLSLAAPKSAAQKLQRLYLLSHQFLINVKISLYKATVYTVKLSGAYMGSLCIFFSVLLWTCSYSKRKRKEEKSLKKTEWESFQSRKLKLHCRSENSSPLIIPSEICFSFAFPPKWWTLICVIPKWSINTLFYPRSQMQLHPHLKNN